MDETPQSTAQHFAKVKAKKSKHLRAVITFLNGTECNRCLCKVFQGVFISHQHSFIKKIDKNTSFWKHRALFPANRKKCGTTPRCFVNRRVRVLPWWILRLTTGCYQCQMATSVTRRVLQLFKSDTVLKLHCIRCHLTVLIESNLFIRHASSPQQYDVKGLFGRNKTEKKAWLTVRDETLLSLVGVAE